MKVCCFGDSNTYGYDPRGCFGGRYSQKSRWVDLVAAGTGWTVCNLGENRASRRKLPLHGWRILWKALPWSGRRFC